MVDVRLLGPVELTLGDRGMEIGPPQRRMVLAALAVDAGRPVAVDVVIERVWGTDPPDGARRALHAHVARIRRGCEQASAAGPDPVGLLRRSGGYVLQAREEQVDVHRFRRLVDRARRSQGPDAVRVALLREALDLWRGAPLAGLGGQWAARVREAWRRQHVDAAVEWARAGLGLGGPGAVIAPLTDLLGEYPLAEPLTEVLMRALHEAGRGAEALDAYAALSRRLAEELGADPGAALRRAHEEILRSGSPRRARPQPAARPVRAAVLAPAAIPAQLPMGVMGFTGREEELARLDGLLGTAAGGPPTGQPAAVVISAVSGTAGVGKTALAVHWAGRVQSAFPDGQLYVNLRGFDSGGTMMDPAVAVRGFLDALGVTSASIPPDPEARAGLYRSLLAGRRVLVVLDNARDAEQVRPLLPGAPGCAALVTSRNQLTSLAVTEGARLLSVGLLGQEASRDLLAGRLGPGRVAAEPGAVNEIVALCAGLPLALAIVAARAAAQPRIPLAVLACELREADGRLDALDGGDPATQIRAVFSWSYRTLSAEAARMFRLLGLHPGPDVTVPAAASLAGVPVAGGRKLLAELVRGHLLTEPAPDRFTFHDLLREYAGELVATRDSGRERHAATRRMLDHYLSTAQNADALLTGRWAAVASPPARPGAITEEPADYEAALGWFRAEHRILLGVVELAARDFGTHTWRLAAALSTFLDLQGHWHALADVQTTALAAAERDGDTAGQADAHRGLGIAHDRLDRPDDARGHYLRALGLFEAGGIHAGRARVHQHLSRLAGSQGRPRQALAHAHASMCAYEAAGDPGGQSAALNHLGWFTSELGSHRQALVYCEQALELARRTGSLSNEAHAMDSLGYIHRRLGERTEALHCYRQALRLFRATGDVHSEATGLAYLADTYDDDGAEPEAAHRARCEALAIADDLGLPPTDPLRVKLLRALAGHGCPAGEHPSPAG